MSAVMMVSAVPINEVIVNAESANNYLGTARKSQYVLYSSSTTNNMQINASNVIVNGNVHSNASLNSYSGKVDIRGKSDICGSLISSNKASFKTYILNENAEKRVLIDPSEAIKTSLGEDYITHEKTQNYKGNQVANTSSIYAKNVLQFNANNISLKNTIISNNHIKIDGTTVNTTKNEEVILYSEKGDITISANDVNINGIIYAPNGKVQIKGTHITINGMVMADKVQINANNVTLNQNLNLSLASAISYYNDKMQVYAEADFDKESSAINLNWESTFDEGAFDIYTSTDGVNFTLLDSVTGINTCAYPTNGSTNDIYFKVKQTLNNAFTKKSNTVKMVYNVELGEYELEEVDTDGEGLADTIEYFLETDINLVDTDGDTLSDYAEVYLTGTDPLYKDSDENEILDCDEDPDGDGLTNIKEIELGTEPQNIDSDYDDLTDGDEVNIYGTIPTKEDTDDDTINDGDEIKLGLNPLLADSDGDGILDGDEKIEQIKTVEIIEEEKPEVTNVSVTMAGTGYIEDNTTIESVYGIDTLSSDVVGLIGAPIEINTTSEFDEATITFTYDDSLLGDTNEEDLAILWYDEQNNFYQIFDEDSIVDTINNTVSYSTTHFSTYMIVDRQAWYDVWSHTISYRRDNGNSNIPTEYFDISYVIDKSGSMLGSNIITAKESINSFIDAMYSNDRASIVAFDYSAHIISDFSSDKTALKDSLSSVSAGGGTNVDAGLVKALDLIANNPSANTKLVLLLCDGDVNCTNVTIQRAKENGVKIYPVLIGSTYGQTALQNIADQIGGTFYYAQTAEEIRKAIFGVQQDTIGDIDTTDTDEDGLYDIYETAGMIIPNGRVIYTNPLTKYSDGDSLTDGEEMGNIENFEDQSFIKKVTLTFKGFNSLIYAEYFDYKSDPTKEDSDGDGINDYYHTYEYSEGTTEFYKDNRPLKKGIYLSELDKVIIGEMVIVSSTYSGNFKGHSFLVYTSYVNDELDFTSFYRGFELGTNNQLEPCLYSLGCNDKVAIGNSGDTEEYDGIGMISHGGMYFNREPKVEFTTSIEYNKNAYLTRQITQDQWNDFLDKWNEVGEYSFNSNNCSEAARKSWNYALKDNLTSKNNIKIINRPNELKESIMEQADYKTGYSIKDEFSKYYIEVN